MDDLMQSVYDDMPTPQTVQRDNSIKEKTLHEIQRLFYEHFFVHVDGIKIYGHLVEHLLINGMVDMTKPQPEQAAIYLEGMRAVIRLIKAQADEHKKRMQSNV